MIAALSWRLLRRELRSGELRLLFAALLIAVAAVTAVGFFGDRVRQGLQREAQQMMGGDLVITAEGSLDGQSPYGKVPCEVSRRAEARGIPTIALAGTIGKGAQETFAHGISAFASIVKRPCSLEEAIAQGDKLLCRAAEDAMRMMMVGQRLARHARAA